MRLLSIIFGVAAYLCVPLYYAVGLFDPPEADGYVCGLYILGPLFIAGISVFLLSCIGTGFGVYSYKIGHYPKSWRRSLEVLTIFFPTIFVVVVTATIFVA